VVLQNTQTNATEPLLRSYIDCPLYGDFAELRLSHVVTWLVCVSLLGPVELYLIHFEYRSLQWLALNRLVYMSVIDLFGLFDPKLDGRESAARR
jgi:hypothetical protein